MLSSIHAIQVADQKLKEAKEEQMTHLIPAKRAADLATELLQLRGRGWQWQEPCPASRRVGT